jgi:pimeloyl-ACP methyl ester carboxylesterase
MRRMYSRIEDRDAPTTWATRQAQYDAVCHWGIPCHARLEAITALSVPVFVANGDRDPMILPRYSHLLAGLIPNARLTIYPDAAHGFLFQHHARVRRRRRGLPCLIAVRSLNRPTGTKNDIESRNAHCGAQRRRGSPPSVRSLLEIAP